MKAILFELERLHGYRATRLVRLKTGYTQIRIGYTQIRMDLGK